MNEQLLKEWTSELRATDKVQGKRYLHRVAVNGEPEKLCCLGILCQVAGYEPSGAEHADVEDVEVYAYGDGISIPPLQISRELGVERTFVLDNGPHDRNDVRVGELVVLNDELGLTFPQIADMIDYFGLVES